MKKIKSTNNSVNMNLDNIANLEFGKPLKKTENPKSITPIIEELESEEIPEEEIDIILDITDPKVVPGIPYFIIHGANDLILFFDVK